MAPQSLSSLSVFLWKPYSRVHIETTTYGYSKNFLNLGSDKHLELIAIQYAVKHLSAVGPQLSGDSNYSNI